MQENLPLVDDGHVGEKDDLVQDENTGEGVQDDNEAVGMELVCPEDDTEKVQVGALDVGDRKGAVRKELVCPEIKVCFSKRKIQCFNSKIFNSVQPQTIRRVSAPYFRVQ